MTKTKYLNEEPFKEELCPDCGKMLRQTRVRIGKNSLKCYRIWVHKETRKRDCYEVDISDVPLKQIMTPNHKSTCPCPDCEYVREQTGT